MPQWSQDLPPGSTVQVFSLSKNSTSSETASPSPSNCSWLGCEVAGTYVPLSQVERVCVCAGEAAPLRAAASPARPTGSAPRAQSSPCVMCDSMCASRR